MSKRTFACIALLCAAAASAIAHADTPGVARLQLANDSERLACFDRAIGDAAHGTAITVAPVATDRTDH